MHRYLVTDKSKDQETEYLLDPHKWVDLYADYLFTYVFTRLNDEHLARDIVQETFLAALEKMDSFKGLSSERTWLTAILKYKLIDIYRKSSSLRGKHAEIEAVHQEPQDFFEPGYNNWKREHWPRLLGIEDKDPLENKELTGILQKCIQKLPALWMAVFMMKHIDDTGTETICRELNISSSNYWVIMHRCKLNLRSCLQKNWI
jgi:RNA polymerase sigma-70 factor (ECF subfamily)